MGQVIVANATHNIDGFAHLIEILVGADGSELTRLVFLRADSPGFVIVPEKSCRTGSTHGLGRLIRNAFAFIATS